MKRLIWVAGIAISAFSACSWDEGECWIDDEGEGSAGAGAGPIVPGAGGYGDVPPDPQDATDPPPPDCNKVADGLCYEKCLQEYERVAAECGKMENETQRDACRDGAHASYKGCRENCTSMANECEEKCYAQNEKDHEKCNNVKDKEARAKCHQVANEQLSTCLQNCRR